MTASFSTPRWSTAADKADINDGVRGQSSADNPDTLYVVAAGNEGNDNDEHSVYPCNTLDGARTDPPNLVCVGMTDRSDTPRLHGQRRAGSVDVFAPGAGIYSTVARRQPATGR